jgi:hypothetical protein
MMFGRGAVGPTLVVKTRLGNSRCKKAKPGGEAAEMYTWEHSTRIAPKANIHAGHMSQNTVTLVVRGVFCRWMTPDR